MSHKMKCVHFLIRSLIAKEDLPSQYNVKISWFCDPLFCVRDKIVHFIKVKIMKKIT